MLRNFRSNSKKILFLFFLIQIALAGVIVPDTSNPLLIYRPNKDQTGQSLIINFSLPKNSQGLGYRQVIAVQFPNSTPFQLDLALDQMNLDGSPISSRFQCTLTDLTNPSYSMPMTALVSNPSDNTTFFCRLEDLTTTLVTGRSYQLVITLTNITLTNGGSSRIISVFTCSGISTDRIIIDWNPTFAELGLYNDFNSISNPPVQITQLSTSPSTFTLLTSFDMYVTILFNNNYSALNSVMIISWPVDIIATGPVTVQTSAASSGSDSSNYIPSTGSLSISTVPGKNNQVIINGIVDDFNSGRSFTLILKGFKSNDIVGSNKLLELSVYYKNSYSILSYSKISTLSTTPPQITSFTITNTDGYDSIFQGGAYSFTFSFIFNTSINQSSFIVIQHKDALIENKKLNFIASTCDFNGNSSGSGISNDYGSRPICYPLRGDFAYPNISSTVPFEGSGIIFKVNSLAATTYTLSVFIFAETCLPPNLTDTTKSAYPTDSATISTNFQFTISIYRNIDLTQMNESRIKNSNIWASATSSSTVKCFGAVSNLPYGSGFSSSDTYNKPSVFLYAELNDFQFSSISTPYYSTCTSSSTSNNLPCLLTNLQLTYGNYAYTIGNLINTNSSSSNSSAMVSSLKGSYLAIVASISINNLTKNNKLCNYIACAKTVSFNPISNYKLQYSLPSRWFVVGDASTNCFFSWGLNLSNWGTPSTPLQTNVLNQISAGQTADTVPQNTAMRLLNIIAAGSSSYGMDSVTFSTSIKLTSTSITDSSITVFPVENSNYTSNGKTPTAILALFSSCVKWSSNFVINSPNNYIDTQFNVLEGTSDIPTKMNRFIKFVTDMYILDHTRLAKSNVGDLSVTFHYVNFPNMSSSSNLQYPSWSNNGVCLLQINNDVKNANTSEQTMLIYLQNLMLFDMDLNDLSSNYPMNINLQSFALNSTPMWVGSFAGSFVTNYPWFKNDYAYGTIDYSSSSVQNPRNEMRTIHKLFLGPLIWINLQQKSLSYLLGKNDLIIPTYCPVTSTTINGNSSSNTYYQPTVNIVFGNSNGFNLSGLSQHWAPYRFNNSNSSYLYFTMSSDQIAKTLPLNINDSPVYTTLRFNSYTLSGGSDNILNILPATITQSNASEAKLSQTWKCTGFIILLSSPLTIDSNVSPTFSIGDTTLPAYIWPSVTGYAQTVVNYNTFSITVPTTKYFYAFGKPFNTAIFSTSKTGLIIKNTSNSTTFQGIKRPTIDSFITTVNGKSYLDPIDKLAFYCQNSGATGQMDSTYFTNYNSNVPNLNNPSVYSFILDWNQDLTSFTFYSAFIGPDKTSEPVYKNDIAGNMKLNFLTQPGVTLPGLGTSQIRISFINNSYINSNTFCAIQQSIATSATNCFSASNSMSSIICPINTTETGYISICCYNINTNADPIPFPILNIGFLSNPNVPSLSKWLWQTTYRSTSSASWVTGNGQGIDMTGSSGTAKLTSVNYNYIFQESSISKVTLVVTLPREPVRDSKITITGDFLALSIPNLKQRCSVTFSLINNKLADWFIESCYIDFSSNKSTISINVSKKIWKCGIIFSKILYINIWPINSLNWSSNSSSYIVQMLLNGANIINTNTGSSTSYIGTALSPKPSQINISNLCNLSNIKPAIVGETSDYVFSFDLSKIAIGNLVNELFIFFPHSLYNVNILDNSEISCYYSQGYITQPVSCYTLEDNWVVISFVKGLTNLKDQLVIISGIQNPIISDVNTFFGCSANFYDISNGLRTSWITGNGTYNNKIIDPPNVGILKLISISTNDTNPRTLVSTNAITLKIQFDVTPNITSGPPSLLSNNPFFLITLPFPDYNLGWYSNNVISSTITEYNTASGSSTPKATIINVSSTLTMGNKIIIELLEYSRKIETTFLYWSISIFNIPQPNDEILTSTGRFKVTLSNKSISSVYRGYVNLSTIYTNPISTSLDSNSYNLINYYRGITYKFNKQLYIIDINNCSPSFPNNSDIRNRIYIKPGRATTCYFTVRNHSINANLQPMKVSFTLNDPYSMFSLNSQTVDLFTSLNSVKFMIGASCGILPGTYYLRFSQSDVTNFYLIPPIPVFVDGSVTAGTATISTIGDVPRASEQPFSLSLSEFTSDNLTYSFVGADNNTNDPSSTMTTIVIPAFQNSGTGKFSIQNPISTGIQSFKATNPNGCWGPNALTANFNVNADPSNFSPSLNLSSYFLKYMNADTDPTGLLSKNSLSFTFQPPLSPMYLICSLTCLSMSYPSLSELLSYSNSSMINPLNQQYVGYFSSSQPIQIIFKNLARGRNYKLFCAGTTTDSTPSLRSIVTATFDKWIVGNTKYMISTSTPLTAMCIQYTFSNDPGTSVKNKLLNYCQKFFTVSLNINSTEVNPACIVCIDDKGNTVSGFKLSNNTTCMKSNNQKRILSEESEYQYNIQRSKRFMQSNNSTNSTNSQSNSTTISSNSTSNSSATNANDTLISSYSICPVQDLICGSDYVSSDYSYLYYTQRYFNAIKSSDDFKTLLNENSVAFLNSTIVNDLMPPTLNLTLSSSSFSASTGRFSFTVKNPTVVNCYWLLTSNNTPIFETITTCIDPYYCGKTIIPTPFPVVSNVSALVPFSYSQTYTFYLACYNNLPNAVSQSNVTVLWSFYTGAPPPGSKKNTTVNTTDSNSTSNTTITPQQLSGNNEKYYSLSVLILLILLI